MKQIYTLIFASLFCAMTLTVSAQTIPGTGISKKSLELNVVDKSTPTMPLAKLAQISRGMNAFIGSYPPNFQSEAERDKVYNAWLVLVSEAEAHAKSDLRDENVLALKSELYRQGHNMDVTGSGEIAMETITTCLDIYPMSVPCNFSATYFFLSIAPTHLDEAEKSLDTLRAHFAPDQDADIESGYVFLHIYKGDSNKAIKQIKKYIEIFPNTLRAGEFKKILNAFENDRVETINQPAPN